MTIALDATDSVEESAGTTATIPGFTATTGAVIRVDIGINSDSLSISGVTYNSVALDELYDATLAPGASTRMASYLAVTGADGAAHDVVVTTSAAMSGSAVIARVSSWTGVESSSVAAAHRTVYAAGQAADGIGVNVTVVDSAANDVVVSAVLSAFVNGGGALAAVETIVGAVALDVEANTNLDFGVQYKTATGASTVMAWTNDGFCTHIAYALVPTIPPPISDQPETLHVIRSGIRLR